MLFYINNELNNCAMSKVLFNCVVVALFLASAFSCWSLFGPFYSPKRLGITVSQSVLFSEKKKKCFSFQAEQLMKVRIYSEYF